MIVNPAPPISFSLSLLHIGYISPIFYAVRTFTYCCLAVKSLVSPTSTQSNLWLASFFEANNIINSIPFFLVNIHRLSDREYKADLKLAVYDTCIIGSSTILSVVFLSLQLNEIARGIRISLLLTNLLISGRDSLTAKLKSQFFSNMMDKISLFTQPHQTTNTQSRQNLSEINP